MKRAIKISLLIAFIVMFAMMFSACSFFPIGNNKTKIEPGTEKNDDDIIINDAEDNGRREPYVEGTLEIVYINVGQGDGMFIMFPDGKSMIIDGGAVVLSGPGAASAIRRNIEFYGVKQIDYLMLTHPHTDHCNALDSILKSYKVSEFFVPPLQASYGMSKASSLYGYYDTKAYYNFYYQMELQLNKGSVINYNIDTFSITGDGYIFDFYCYQADVYEKINGKSSNDEVNSLSPISFLTYNDARYSFVGDANSDTEQYFLSTYVTEENKDDFKSNVLKVGHHGSKTSTTAEFLEVIQPEVAIISLGSNVYGHPTPEVLKRLNNIGSKIYITKEYGDIIVTQKEYEITAFSNSHFIILYKIYVIPPAKYYSAA